MSDRLRPLIGRAAEGPLTREQAEVAFTAIMDGDATPAQIGGFLMALRTRGETVAEYAAAAAVMRARCLRVRAPEGAMDIVGTGGDGKGTLNISTAAALVVAGAGVPVAKHGNRNLSSKSGAADALTELGVNVMVGPEVVERALAEAGIGFMMAPMHHPATRHVMPARQELGTRTIFNILGPLTNPASVRRQLTGAYTRAVIRPMAETLGELGSDRAWLVHGADGTDEISIAGETFVAELNDGKVREFSVHPEDAGLTPHPLEAVLGGTPGENAAALRGLLAGEHSAYRDAVLLERRRGAAHRRPRRQPRRGRSAGGREPRLRRRTAHRRKARRCDHHPCGRRPPMSILEQIRDYKLADIARRKAERPLATLEAFAHDADRPRDFVGALRRVSARGYGLIAEIKKASPSKGLIRADFEPAALAAAYASGGATCLSVLTDGPSFQGDDSHLIAARAAVTLPILRKDFLYDPWQVVESRTLGADCILIILASVSDTQAQELESTAAVWGMAALLEVHTPADLERAKLMKSPLVGINNRDLNTFETSLDTTKRLARSVPADRVIVSESGLATRQDLAQIARYGVRCFLIGETLMREPNVEAATRELLRSPWSPEAE